MVCSDIASPHWLLSCFPSDRKKKASNCCLFPWLLWVTDLQYPLQTGSLYCLAFPPTKGRRLSKTLKLPPACVWVEDMGKKYIAPPDGHSDMRLGSRHEYIALSRQIDSHCVIVWLSLLLLLTNAQSCCLWGSFFEAALIDCINNKFVAEQSRVAVRWDQPIPEAPQMEKKSLQASFRSFVFERNATLLLATPVTAAATQNSRKAPYAKQQFAFPPAPCIENCHVLFQVNIRVTGEHFLTILGPRTRLDTDECCIQIKQKNIYFL